MTLQNSNAVEFLDTSAKVKFQVVKTLTTKARSKHLGLPSSILFLREHTQIMRSFHCFYSIVSSHYIYINSELLSQSSKLAFINFQSIHSTAYYASHLCHGLLTLSALFGQHLQDISEQVCPASH